MKVMGIDPGTLRVGYGVVEEKNSRFIAGRFGALSIPGKKPIAQRLKIIHESLYALLQEEAPHVVAVEEVFYGKSVKSAIRIGEGRAVAMLAAAQLNLPVFEYSPAVVKKAVTGKGGAHKVQVQNMVQAILNLPQKPDPSDAADALALAICHHHRSKLAAL
jgi:crossover junction endodeoxyribonuclease RuvC